MEFNRFETPEGFVAPLPRKTIPEQLLDKVASEETKDGDSVGGCKDTISHGSAARKNESDDDTLVSESDINDHAASINVAFLSANNTQEIVNIIESE